MANYTIKASNHAEWLEARKQGVGASEIGTILGVNPYDTPYQLWLRKTGRAPMVEENFLMKAGHYLESAIAQFCADETGVEIIKRSAGDFIVVDQSRQFLRVSPDRYAWLPNSRHTKENKVIIECKSTQKQIFEDDIPLSWFTQVMYQLGVCEMSQAYLAWLTQGREFGYKHIVFDADFYNDVIVPAVEKFWVDNILADKEPDLINIEDVKLKFPRHNTGKAIEASDELLDRYNTLVDVNRQIKQLSEVKEEAENALRFAMQDAESIIVPTTQETPFKTLVTWKAAKDSTRFDEKAFASENPELYARYMRNVQGSRRFMVK